MKMNQVTVITTFDALMNTMPRDAQVWDSVLHIAQGDTLDLDALVEQLVRMGYERQYQVDNIGQFALRGGILDIFPLTEENPVRIELWDDEVDTLRTFDVESQKSIENIEKLVVYPACELVLSTEEKAEGIRRLLKEAEAFSDKLRKEMKTEEAYRALSPGKRTGTWNGKNCRKPREWMLFCPISAGNGGAFWIILIRQIHLCFSMS